MKQFIKKHPKHTLLYALGGTLVAAIIGMGGLIWNSSNSIYADQGQQKASDYIIKVSKALAGAGSTSAASQSQSSRQSTAPTAPSTTTQTAPTVSTTVTAPATVAAASTSTATTTSSLRGLNLYVDPTRSGLPSPLNSSPVATWFGNWNSDVQANVNTVVTAATNGGSVSTLVAYNIPGRDCGSYSAGGANGTDAYKAWIRSFAAGIGSHRAIVILEPDALAQVTCLDATSQAERYSLLQDAINVLTSTTKASVYLDAGNSSWIGASDMSARLQKAGIGQATGFSLNVSNFETTSNSTSYGNTISSNVGGKHFVIDTSRNGNGPGTDWCNPSGRALGALPTVNTPGNVDAYLWIKVPGESDGTCNGGPAAGTYWASYAQSLIDNRH